MSSLVLPLNIGPRMSCISPSLQADSELAPVTVETDVVPSQTDILKFYRLTKDSRNPRVLYSESHAVLGASTPSAYFVGQHRGHLSMPVKTQT